MPQKRLSRELWRAKRERVLRRDAYRCVRCQSELSARTAHIDHIQSGKLGTNRMSNLRALCVRCHALRADGRHRALTAKAVRDGLIPANWRELVWEE